MVLSSDLYSWCVIPVSFWLLGAELGERLEIERTGSRGICLSNTDIASEDGRGGASNF